jgi:hypothetical protein
MCTPAANVEVTVGQEKLREHQHLFHSKSIESAKQARKKAKRKVARCTPRENPGYAYCVYRMYSIRIQGAFLSNNNKHYWHI